MKRRSLASRSGSGDHAASYLGLTPSTKQSANSCYHGPLTKRGNSQARWMMVASDGFAAI